MLDVATGKSKNQNFIQEVFKNNPDALKYKSNDRFKYKNYNNAEQKITIQSNFDSNNAISALIS